MQWPSTADGDVFRRLQADGFNFDLPCEIDFNVDFQDWPPAEEAIHWLHANYAQATIYPPSDDFNGYVQFKVNMPLTYELVIHVQEYVSTALRRFGGVCESWGVLHG